MAPKKVGEQLFPFPFCSRIRDPGWKKSGSGIVGSGTQGGKNQDPAVLRIRDVYPGSRIRLFSIPDPGSSSKNLSILTPKKAKKWFLSSKKYDPGCSSRIPDPDTDFLPSRIPDPGVKKVPNPGSRIRIRNTGIRDEHSGSATTLGLAIRAHLSEEEILSQTWVSSSSMVRSISFSAKYTHHLSWTPAAGTDSSDQQAN